MSMKENEDPNGGPNTLCVVNLNSSITEDLIVAMFGQVGGVKSCRIIREPGYDPHCFVEYEKHSEAKEALSVMNKQTLNGREIKVYWASDRPVRDMSQHHSIFVRGLSPEIDMKQLRNAFSNFGEISYCYVARDPVKRKSYGFCSFLRKEEAAAAIKQMDGHELGGRRIWTKWVDRKPMNYDSPNNCTLHVIGFPKDKGALRRAFNPFGRILTVTCFKDKDYAFVRYDNKVSACTAIVSLNLTVVGGQVVKCSWAKEGGDSSKGQKHFAEHKVKTGGDIAETGGDQVNSGGYQAEQEGYIAPGNVIDSFRSPPLKELPGPFHAPRPQQHSGFWM